MSILSNPIRTAAAIAAAVSLIPASAALAAYPNDPVEPPDDPIEHVAKPDLRVTAAEAVAMSSGGWQITYTVRNQGDAASGGFQVAAARDTSGTPATRMEPGLASQATVTHAVALPRSSCYAAFRLVVDAPNAVVEHSEINNETWTVGQAASVCADAPRYTVKAVDLKALRTQEGTDEPYVTVSTVSDSAATTVRSNVVQDVDEGETVAGGALLSCFYGSGSICEGRAAPHGIGLSVQLFDHDSGDLSAVRARVAEAFDKAGPISVLLGAPLWVTAATMVMDDVVDTVLAWIGDDVIGSGTWAYSPADLARILRTPGSSIMETRPFSGGEHAGDAFYHLRLKITRVS